MVEVHLPWHSLSVSFIYLSFFLFLNLLDHVFGPEVITTKDIFENVAQEIVDATLQGFNGTIFAYGQTSAGKTFTMKGSDQNEGIIPLAISHIFKQIKNVHFRNYIQSSFFKL